MELIPLADPADPRLAEYHDLRDAERRVRDGVFVAEGPTVVRALLASPRFRTRSILVTPALLGRLGGVVERSPIVYLAPAAVIARVAGFAFHRGCVGLGERRAPLALDAVLGAHRIVVLEDLTQADNVGGVFRNARAFGAEAVVLSPGCCDPLYRKAVRLSAGAAVHVPFVRAAGWPGDLARLRDAGFALVALTPRAADVELRSFARPRRVALLLGTEGLGLSAAARAAADVRVRIGMAEGVDSLNVATASGIALHWLAGEAP